MELDSQIDGLLGRQRLIGELIRDGLEVAVPVRDRGVDLIAYADLSRQVSRFASRPIQMKASTTSRFGVDQKYVRISDLILAYVWHLADPQAAVTYALPYAEAVKVAEAMGWTKTASWLQGQYSTSSSSKRLLSLLEPYRISEGRGWAVVVGSALSGFATPRCLEALQLGGHPGVGDAMATLSSANGHNWVRRVLEI